MNLGTKMKTKIKMAGCVLGLWAALGAAAAAADAGRIENTAAGMADAGLTKEAAAASGLRHCSRGEFYTVQSSQEQINLETMDCTHGRGGYIHYREQYRDIVTRRCAGCGFEETSDTGPYWTGWSCVKIGM